MRRLRLTPWPAVLAVARADLRNRWRSMVVVGLIAGLVAGVVGGAAAVTRRTATAYDRLQAATHLDDARALLFSDSVTPGEVRRLPGVEESWTSRQLIGQVLGRPVLYVSVSSGPPRPADLFTPVVVRGRLPRDDDAREVVVPEILAREVGFHVGDRLVLALLTPLEVTQFDTGFGAPDGPRLPLRVVGVYRTARAWVGNGIGPVIGSPALRRAVPGSFVGWNVQMRLAEGPAGAHAMARRLGKLADRTATGATGQEFGTLAAAYPTSDRDTDEVAARHTLVAGLLVLLAVALLGGLLAVGQALARHHAAGAGDQELEAVLGLTRGERVLARLLPATVGAAFAGALGAVGTLAAGRVEPLGALAAFEPRPGFLPQGAVAAAVALLAALAFLGLAGVTAARAVRDPAADGRRAELRPLPRLGRRAATVAGLAFALRRQGGRAGVPVRAAAVVAVCGVAGVVAVGAFAASLHRLVHTPARYGWVADFATIDAKPEDTAALAADPRVRSVAVGDGSTVRIGGRPMVGVTLHKVRGPVPVPVLGGRLPLRPGEVALGPLDLSRLGLQVGDRVTLTTYDGGRRGSRSLHVVGAVILPDVNGDRVSSGAVLSPSDLRVATRAQTFADALVDVRDDADVGPMVAQLSRRLELTVASPPPQIRNLSGLGRLPTVLAAFLAVLAVVVLGHSLVLTARRRGADLAVLRVIGLTPRQVAATMGVMAGTIVLIGVVAGPLLGLAVGRVVWAEVAANVGVAGDLAVPWWLLVAVPPAALVVTTAVVVLPARRAAALSPARVLRAE